VSCPAILGLLADDRARSTGTALVPSTARSGIATANSPKATGRNTAGREREGQDLSAADLRAQLGRFHPPVGYVRLNQHPQMLAVCEKVEAATPVRQLSVHHQ
jgi:hypothetical protein